MTLVLLIGQSNAEGFLNTGPAPYAPTARVQIWTGTEFNYMNPGANTGPGGEWGAEVAFANRWLAEHPTGMLYIGKVVAGSTGLAYDVDQTDWSPHSTGEMFKLAKWNALRLQANLGEPLDAVLMMQGETDAFDAAKAGAYEANLREFITEVRAQFVPGGDADLPFVYGRINDSTPYFEQVRWAQYVVDRDDPYATSFDTYSYTTAPDGLHYDAPGQLRLGSDLFEAWAF